MAQEPEDSSPHSQQPATGQCPETVESNPHPQANLPKIHPCTLFSPLPFVLHAPLTSVALTCLIISVDEYKL
jgi:hypothetical protein